MSICPICGEEVRPRGANKAFPFCTTRCKSIDLGKWLSEDYRVPGAPGELEDLAANDATDDATREREGGGEGGADDEHGHRPVEDVRHRGALFAITGERKPDMRH